MIKKKKKQYFYRSVQTCYRLLQFVRRSSLSFVPQAEMNTISYCNVKKHKTDKSDSPAAAIVTLYNTHNIIIIIIARAVDTSSSSDYSSFKEVVKPIYNRGDDFNNEDL